MLSDQRHRIRFGIARLAWLAALLGMLACPLTYKGGAELPHAHALFQLLYDAAHGSIDHHHDGDPATDNDLGAPLPMAQAPVSTPAVGAHVSPMGESADGLAIALVVAAVWLMRERGRWPAPIADSPEDGERPAPEPPPPRRLLAAV